ISHIWPELWIWQGRGHDVLRQEAVVLFTPLLVPAQLDLVILILFHFFILNSLPQRFQVLTIAKMFGN
ncbi:MAG: hypothetical protein AAF466_09150, partial [Bacteroidota bacterium]